MDDGGWEGEAGAVKGRDFVGGICSEPEEEDSSVTPYADAKPDSEPNSESDDTDPGAPLLLRLLLRLLVLLVVLLLLPLPPPLPLLLVIVVVLSPLLPASGCVTLHGSESDSSSPVPNL